MRMPSFMDYFL